MSAESTPTPQIDAQWSDEDDTHLFDIPLESPVEAEVDAQTKLDILRTDATEILGNSIGGIRGRYRNAAGKIEMKALAAEADADVPSFREKVIEFRINRTQNKISRLEGKLGESSGSFISKQVDRQRRYKLKQLTYKQGILKPRATSLEKKRQQKPEELRKQIDAIVKKRVESMRRKATRKIAKQEKGIGVMNRMKREKFLAELTDEQKRKIVHEAIKQVRKKNIQRGVLDEDYTVDMTAQTRKIGEHYGRTT